MIKLRQSFLCFVLTAILSTTSIPTSNAAIAIRSSLEPKSDCRIDIPLAHEASSMRRMHQIVSVKANALVTCNKPLYNLVVTIDLYKQGFLMPTLLEKFKSLPLTYTPGKKPLKISGKPFICTNWKRTKFFSKVSCTAIMDGSPAAAQPSRSFSVALECGN